MSKYYPEPVEPKFETHKVVSRDRTMVDVECLVVTLEGEDYEVCWSTDISSSEKTTEYGSKDCYNGPVEEYQGRDNKAAHGFFGEVALAKIFSLPVDTTYRPKGDQHDFIFSGLTTDMKMGMLTSWRVPNITAENKGRVHEPKQLYIMGFVVEHEIGEYVKVAIVGFMDGKVVGKCQLRNSVKYGGVSNYDVYYTDAEPIRDIL